MGQADCLTVGKGLGMYDLTRAEIDAQKDNLRKWGRDNMRNLDATVLILSHFPAANTREEAARLVAAREMLAVVEEAAHQRARQ